jgi:dolichol-phosphate mannosyltransferase
MNYEILNVIVIPSYNEKYALPKLLEELKSGLSIIDAIVVMDDSPRENSIEIEKACREILQNLEFRFENSTIKSGRGAAVRRGMAFAISEYPNVQNVLECDADGSHRAEDILKIMNSASNCDLLIGSRYLDTSEIVGWPVSRRLFSWILNKIIPRLTGVDVQDITNGLRRYSKNAIIKILSAKQVNSGFIYLSEQAILLTEAGMKIEEEPIVFVDRTLGESTVTWREIVKSLYGIFGLITPNLRK